MNLLRLKSVFILVFGVLTLSNVYGDNRENGCMEEGESCQCSGPNELWSAYENKCKLNADGLTCGCVTSYEGCKKADQDCKCDKGKVSTSQNKCILMISDGTVYGVSCGCKYS